MLSKLIKETDIKNLKKKGIPYAVEKQKLIERSGWRTFKPVIDYKKCIKCGMCWLHCPDSAYTINKKGYPVCDGKVCKGCLLCVDICPVNAISIEKEKRNETKKGDKK
ncbi:4Fe-4S binding protein [Candidatus Woesearchaeota archaeon]|nr:4Fe-4S binding protein [Candidatus Woesearchaeota archaeon]